MIEIVESFISKSCGDCSKAKESLKKDFLPYGVTLVFHDVVQDEDPEFYYKAQNAGVLSIPAFVISGVIFYSIYGKNQLDSAIKNIELD